jgi:ankyrin repeat protein
MITSLQKQERLKELSTTQFGPDGNTIWHELLLNICDEDTVDIFHERLLEASTGNLVAMQLVVMRTENAAGISLYECFYTKKLFPWIEKDYWVSSEPFKAVQSEECQTSIQQKKSTYEAKVLKVQKLYDSLVRNEKIVTDTLNQTSTEDLKELLTCPRQENKLLHLAIKKEGDLDVVTRICLLVGQDVKKYLDKKHNGKSALYLAAELGKGEIAKLLRKKYDAAVEKTGPKECPSAMLVAAKNGFYELVTILIDSKPRVSAFAETITRTTRDDKGLTPIHYVAMGGSAKQIQHLLITNKNANPLAENYGKLKDGEDFTALDRIVRRKDAETLLNDLSGLFNFESVENKKSNLFDLFNVDTPGGRQCLSPFAYALLFNYPVAEFINKCRDKPLTDGALNEKRGSLQDYRRNVVEELSGVVAFDETGDEGFDSPPPIFGSPPSSDDDLPQPVSDDVRGSEFNPPLSAQVDLDGAQTLTVPTSEPSHIERNDDVDNQPDPPATATDADRQALFAKIAVDSGIPNPGGRFADRFVTAIKALWRGLIDAVKYVARSFGIIS